jgi:hypothetical protein
MNKIKFNAIIEKHHGMDAAYVKFPFDVQKVFGAKGQVKIKAIFDGNAEYRGSLANMGLGFHMLGLTKDIRAKINKSFGDTVSIELEKDVEERVVIVPDYVSELLDKNPDAKNYYNSLSYTDRKEYIRWIESAKKEETKANRIETFLEKLKCKKKFSDK